MEMDLEGTNLMITITIYVDRREMMDCSELVARIE